MAEQKRKGISVVPPADEDDDRLRRALGHHSAPVVQAPTAPSIAASDRMVGPTAKSTASKVTVSVRMSPETKADLESLGDAIGWSSNRIMTAIIEGQASELMQVYRTEGVAGALRLLGRG